MHDKSVLHCDFESPCHLLLRKQQTGHGLVMNAFACPFAQQIVLGGKV